MEQRRAGATVVTTIHLAGADHFSVFDPWLDAVVDLVEQWMEDR